MESFELLKDYYYFGDLCYVIDNCDWDEYFLHVEVKGIYKEKSFIQVGIGGDGLFENYRGLPTENQIHVDSGSVGMIPIDILDEDVLALVLKSKAGFIYEANHDLKIDLNDQGIHIYPKSDEYVSKDSIMFALGDDLDVDMFMRLCPPLAENQNTKRSFHKRNALLNRKHIKEEWHRKIKKYNVKQKKALWLLKKYHSKLELMDLEGGIDELRKIIQIDPKLAIQRIEERVKNESD